MNARASANASPGSLISVLVAMLPLWLAQGCMKVTIQGYEEVTVAVDDLNELHISTFPSWFPRQTASVPFLYKELRTPDTVKFQLFVRAKGKKAGPNPNIDAIMIHSFSYEFPGQAPVQLITDYGDNYWQQGNSNDDPDDSSPVPVSEGWYLVLKVDMTLNGTRHRLETVSHATSRQRLRPLWFEVLD